MSTVSTSDHSASHAVPAKRFKHGSALPQGQMTLFGHSADPHIVERVNIAIADLLHSNGLPSSLAEDDKFTKLISLSRQLPKKYVLPNHKKVGGQLLDAIYEESFKSSMKTLLSESKIYGVSVFGDGATIAKIPLINVLGASPNNSFALLDIIDCTSEMASGGKKTASYIAGLLKPVIKRIEDFRDPITNQSHPGVVDLLLFDGASNVQNAGKHLAITNPRQEQEFSCLLLLPSSREQLRGEAARATRGLQSHAQSLHGPGRGPALSAVRSEELRRDRGAGELPVVWQLRK